LKNSLKNLIDTAQAAPDTVIVAADEASLYLQATLQVVWAPRGETPVNFDYMGCQCMASVARAHQYISLFRSLFVSTSPPGSVQRATATMTQTYRETCRCCSSVDP
jgi:hypothetical protein